VWTDSTIVLCWLKQVPTHWKIFVANRVSEIQDITDVHSWRHVRSADNTADYVSRGVVPQLLPLLSQWWNGPDLLHSEGSHYDDASSVELVDVPELRAATVALTSVEHSVFWHPRVDIYQQVLYLSVSTTK
jgi:hypothetical protein